MIEICPLNRPLQAVVEVPGSKSISNRALPIAALANGTSILHNMLFSDDSRYFMSCLQQIGYRLEIDETNRIVTVEGRGGVIPEHTGLLDLFVGNAGTAARFLTAFVSLGKGSYRIDGIPRMRERPIQDLINALRTLGVNIRSELGTGCPPVLIEASGIKGGAVSIPGTRSSQYLSALLLAAPYAQSDVDIQVDGELLSAPYINMTLSMMEQFGVRVEKRGDGAFHVPGGQMYTAREYVIEPDASSASYFIAAPAIAGGKVRVNHLSRTSLQGDAQFAGLMERMGCQVRWGHDFIEVERPAGQELRGIDVDLNEMSDTTMTLAVVAPFASTSTTIRNIGHIRIKETDRIHAVVTELRKMGVRVDEWEDGMRIEPAERLQPAEIDTYDDHRMAMAFALVGLKVPGIKIKDPECVSKTFPDYFDVFTHMCRQTTT
ncbi:3-phosphoshikimate 1-carboxyvinyltransferase [Effusibacillus lacus]|uniref:3-phosphoshikimate 1-carboxyvinyltransferase n=1 Tax=Effusibacillus lacus TaxID=1348429 RepID=A0A292YKP6_9BACL|nr:3-phosphoshikimate 1-carboxyvinyltransferase [Effusibacillus lacus]TCS75310.1 3-phosphoshikimate 1-carboxyvinyltransferase [Effusibacillus lacus]GAX89746.1 3-phosphoshikimate 1-carboxyvinyltransferase [Effusibacillus lacus]